MSDARTIRFTVLIVLSAFFLSGCATGQTKSPLKTGKMEVFLKDVCAQNGVYWRWDPVAQVATLRHSGSKAEVLVGSDQVLIDDTKVTLSAPVRMIQSAVVVPRDFRSAVIIRMLSQKGSKQGFKIAKVRKVIIDAGHGGKDPGAIGRDGVQEKDIVLDICKRIRDILKKRGVNVKMTRDSDTFISLKQRTEIASREKADLFVSVHANAHTTRGAHGIEVFSAKDIDYKDRNEDQRKRNQQLLYQSLSMKKGSATVDRIVSDLLYTHKQVESRELAAKIAGKISKRVKTRNRGQKSARFYVLRNTLVPAVLVEVGFLTNPKESKLLQTSSYRQNIARSIADNIIDYANSI